MVPNQICEKLEEPFDLKLGCCFLVLLSTHRKQEKLREMGINTLQKAANFKTDQLIDKIIISD